MRSREFGWLVGLYEGEGGCGHGRSEGHVWLRISQRDPEILLWCQNLMGGKIYSFYNRKGLCPDKPMHCWHLAGPGAIGLLMTMYSLLSTKRKAQAKEVLMGWKHKVRNPNKTQGRRTDLEKQKIGVEP